MKKSLGNIIKFKKAKPPLNKKIIGNYCLLEPLNIRKHSLQLYKNFLRDKKNRIWDYLPYGPFNSYVSFKRWLKKDCLKKDPYFFAIYSKKYIPLMVPADLGCPIPFIQYKSIIYLRPFVS